MRVLFCGDRRWRNRAAIRRELEALPKGTIVVEGEAAGADTIAREEAEKLGLPVQRFPAHWDLYGNHAGTLRNREQLRFGEPDEVRAFVLPSSRGTWHMIKIAEAAGVPVRIIRG